MEARKPFLGLFCSGAGSGTLYALLYAYEAEIMFYFTRTDGLYPALPIVAAFVFSLIHGAFAAFFWEVIGIRARRR